MAQFHAGANISRQHGFPLWEGWTSIPLGWVLATEGDVEAGLACSKAGSNLYIETAGEWSLPYATGIQAELEMKAGRTQAGLECIDRGLQAVNANDDRWYEAELYRLRGELLLADGSGCTAMVRAEECFASARAIAAQQGAKAWELRAATSLARLWQQRGKRAEAHQLLSDIYSWFSEGFDTKDLQNAKALLEELA